MSKARQGGPKKPAKSITASAFEQAALAAGLSAQAGKDALENRYRAGIEAKANKTRFTGSVDLDDAFRAAEPTANRWDYGLGVQPAGGREFALWVEPHSASSLGEVRTILAKLDWLKAKLGLPAFRPLKALTDECVNQGHRPYHWMATAHVGIRPGSREAMLLAQRGMTLPSTRVRI
jgi:hypothetical protein